MVVGSPSTLGADKVWRAWLAWVRDRGAFLTPNALPQLPWEAAAAAEAERQEVHLRALEAAAELDPEVLGPSVTPVQDPEEVVASAARASGEGSLGVALRERSAAAGDGAGERDAAASGAGLRGGSGGDDGRDVDSEAADSDTAGVEDAAELSLGDAGAPLAGAASRVGGAGSKGFSGADLEGWLDGS